MTYSDSSQSAFDGIHSSSRRSQLLTAFAVLVALALFVATAAPRAAAISDEEELTRIGSLGSGAGQLNLPHGIATDPVTGHVFVADADASNNRVSEFTPWGNFVKAFGWDVAPGAVNEQQEVRVRAASGQFKLTFGASTTTDLAFDAPGSAVQAALNALPSIGGAGGEVSVQAVPGTPDGKTPAIYVVAFKGSLAATNVADLTATNGATPLDGGVPSEVLEARIRAEGHAATGGLESCTVESGCQAGLSGPGVGQFANVAGVAVDAAGNVYVRELSSGGNGRVQKFDAAGRFLLTFGGEVNKTAVGLREEQEANAEPVTVTEAEENLCTAFSGDECGIGVAGSGKGQFGASGASSIVLGSGSKLFVGDVERIQRFNLEGEYEAEVPVPGTTVSYLAIAPGSGDFYATVGPLGATDEHVRILDLATGAEIGQLKGTGKGQGAVATDSAGNVFLEDGNRVLQFDSAGKALVPPSCCEAPIGVAGLATNAIGDLYVAYAQSGVDSFIRVFGPAPVTFEGAPQVPPTIVGQFAASVDRTSALLGVEINPHFWADTRYYVQYGTGKCSEGGCEAEKPLPPGALLTSKVIAAPVQSAPILLDGLDPGTTYHYRFVAESSGGGPVRGIGGEVGTDGEESTFTTYPASAPAKVDCPNQQFRIGFSAPLPDCRAYEMVSPVDKNNGDIKALLDVPSNPTAHNQSASAGGRFTYSSYRGFGDLEAAPYTNQYIASRKDGVGWSSETINVAETSYLSPHSLENHYKAFSSDLCKSWLMVAADPALAPGTPSRQPAIYRRDLCGAESAESLIQVDLNGDRDFYPVLQGLSADGKEAILAAESKLTDDAVDGDWQAYYASGGSLRLLCILPSGAPNSADCSAGTSGGGASAGGAAGDSSEAGMERKASVAHALSADGTRAYWTDLTPSADQDVGPGRVYLRLNPGEEQSAISAGACTEPEKACTVKVSETKTSQPARFLGASADGARALFEVSKGALAGDLYLFDAEAGSSTLVAGETRGVAASSEDLSRVYFLSGEALGGGAIAGEPNLYLEQEGTKTFVATLAEDDVNRLIPGTGIASDGLSVADPAPIYRTTRATADGGVLVFTSAKGLTGQDNVDLESGKADLQVFRYEAELAELTCISCNPSGARPRGKVVAASGQNLSTGQARAGWLPGAASTLHSPRVLSPDGQRLFFNSFDALLLRDTNGKGDVYKWEAASGQGECDEKGAELYVPSAGGCLSLISSGQSPEDSELLDTSANGDDVFFATSASLLPQDPGLIDVYDARANGGLPAPPEPPGPCQGEACQFAPPPPTDPTPASASFRGAGDPKAKANVRKRCAKGKARRKGRCVAKRKATRKAAKRKRANANRRASR
ncbi:MAG: hypothetical protein ABW196_12440 [Solirubrobacterales bacterium]